MIEGVVPSTEVVISIDLVDIRLDSICNAELFDIVVRFETEVEPEEEEEERERKNLNQIERIEREKLERNSTPNTIWKSSVTALIFRCTHAIPIPSQHCTYTPHYLVLH